MPRIIRCNDKDSTRFPTRPLWQRRLPAASAARERRRRRERAVATVVVSTDALHWGISPHTTQQKGSSHDITQRPPHRAVIARYAPLESKT